MWTKNGAKDMSDMICLKWCAQFTTAEPSNKSNELKTIFSSTLCRHHSNYHHVLLRLTGYKLNHTNIATTLELAPLTALLIRLQILNFFILERYTNLIDWLIEWMMFVHCVSKTSDFYYLGYTISSGNLTPEAYRFVHLTCILWPHYLKKYVIFQQRTYTMHLTLEHCHRCSYNRRRTPLLTLLSVVKANIAPTTAISILLLFPVPTASAAV